MTIEVFWGSGSPFAWRVLLALEFKGLPWDSKLISFSRGEHRTPEFLAMNPRHKVPVLRDGDVVVYESLAVMAYLDRAYPERPLFGAGAAEVAGVWTLVCELDNYLSAPSLRMVQPIYFNQLDTRREECLAAASTVKAELDGLEERMGDAVWVAKGDAPSAADAVLHPVIMSIQRAASSERGRSLDLSFLPFAERFPRLAAWNQRVQALPGYDATYPPHWR